MTPGNTNPYKVLGLDPGCTHDEIKRRFRQQIALYHPDKVQHLGQDIQDLATTRAAELTEAYEILSESATRSAVDADLPSASSGYERGNESARFQASAAPQIPRSDTGNLPLCPAGEAEVSDLVRKATINRLRAAVEGHLRGSDAQALPGFDAAFVRRPKWSLFKPQQSLTVLARFVGKVDAEAVGEAWRLGLRPGAVPPGEVFLFLMGNRLEDARILSRAIMENRRKSAARPGLQILVVPWNISTWEVLTPCEAPALARAIIGTLRSAQ